jgi:hypothetical protein
MRPASTTLYKCDVTQPDTHNTYTISTNHCNADPSIKNYDKVSDVKFLKYLQFNRNTAQMSPVMQVTCSELNGVAVSTYCCEATRWAASREYMQGWTLHANNMRNGCKWKKKVLFRTLQNIDFYVTITCAVLVVTDNIPPATNEPIRK